jgi:uncharacterized membrane protein (DUF2068 family)
MGTNTLTPQGADTLNAPPKRETGLIVIATFKLTGALLLTTVALGAMHLVTHDAADTVEGWLNAIGADVKGDAIQNLLENVAGIPARRFEQVGLGASIYAALLVTQGIGLLRRKLWAEWLTVFVTSSFLPVEIWELAKGVRPLKVSLLVVNIAIVVYLVRHIRRKAAAARAAVGG